jgi:hypothetical protein
MKQKHAIGQRGGADTGGSFLWFALGGVAGIGLYYLLRPRAAALVPAGSTQVMPVPSTQAPALYNSLAEVDKRFADVRDLYHMARLTPDQAITQVDELTRVAQGFASRDPDESRRIVADLVDFRAKIVDFVEFQRSLAPA